MIKKIFFVFLFISTFPSIFCFDSLAVTRTWDGGAGTTDFNTAANWSGDVLPSATDSCVISTTQIAVTLSSNITIGALYLNNTSNTGNNSVLLRSGAYVLTVNRTTTIDCTGSSANAETAFYLNNSNGAFNFIGNVFVKNTGVNGSVYPFYSAINGQGTVTYKGNLSITGAVGANYLNLPAILNFDALNSQTISCSTSSGVFYLGATTNFGLTNSPTITLTGSSAIQAYNSSLFINGSTTLDIASKTIDRNVAGGSFNMASGSTLKIGGTGDFPANFTTYALNSNSNTYYNGTTQSVTAVSGGYGNLFIEGAGSTKTLAASTVDVNGNLTITSGTLAASSFLMTLAGNFTNNSTYTCGTGTITFDGTSNQNITGSNASTLYRMTVNNSAGVSVLKGATVTNLLTFTSGNVTAATSTEPIKLDVSATVSGNGDGKCVVGYCAKNTNTTTKFTFPVGTSSTQRMMSVTPSTTSATTWLVKYFAVGYSDVSITGVDMGSVSSNEYWTLDRLGTAKSTVELTWDAASGVTDVSKVWVAHYNGSDWEIASSEGGSGNLSAGVKSSSSNWDSYSPFTFGFSADGTVLPIELISFSAKKLKSDVLVSWKTASEINNDYFTVERSFDENILCQLQE